MIKVLIADNDLDSHELIDDLVEMIFRDVQIDRALSRDSLFLRVGVNGSAYDLVLFNYTMDKEEINEVITYLNEFRPELLNRMVFITSGEHHLDIPAGFPILTRPFSLDDFSELVKKICVTK